jgi:putative acyl-CoA dehydrogenase
MEKTSGFESFRQDARRRLDMIRGKPLGTAVDTVRHAIQGVEEFAERIKRQGREFAEPRARGFAYAIARVAAALLLIEHADWSLALGDDDATVWAKRWCERDLVASIEQGEGPVPSPILIG